MKDEITLDQLIYFAKRSVGENGRAIDSAYLSAMEELKEARKKKCKYQKN